MSGCSLQEAFPDTAKQSGQIAKNEERQKAKRCNGPALAFLKATESLDPDRRQHPLPPSEKLGGREGYHSKMIQGFVSQDSENKEFMPIKVSDLEQESRELSKNLVGSQVDDVIGEKTRKSLPRSAESASNVPDFTRTMYGEPVPSYFGKSVEEKFADFSSSMSDTAGYKVQGSDFLGSFEGKGLDKATGKLVKPVVTDAWKPLTPGGARSSFFDSIPDYQQSGSSEKGVFSLDEKQTLLSKLDTLFARLEELESKKNEYAHAEVTLFILSGLFLMFGFETVRKFGV